jgi:hypothetical protein
MTDLRTHKTLTAPGISLFLAWLVLLASFIPVCRLLDSHFPNSHMGFQLLGIWLFGLLPAFAILGVLTILLGRRNSISHQHPDSRFVGVASTIYVLVFLLFLLDYRCGGPF